MTFSPHLKLASVVVDFLFIVTPIVGVCNCSMFCCTLLYVHSSIAIILMGKRELVAFLNLSSLCLVWLSGSSSRCHGVVCGLWLWYFLIILTIFILGNSKTAQLWGIISIANELSESETKYSSLQLLLLVRSLIISVVELEKNKCQFYLMINGFLFLCHRHSN